MSSSMAGANKEQPAGMRRNKIRFCEDGPAARCASAPADPGTKERVAVWDAVSAYVQEQLLGNKGVWIPTFGSFDTVSKVITTANGTVTLRWPVFHLARNLRATHNLTSDKESLSDHKELEPLKYSEVAAAASVTRQRGTSCIQSTVSLLSRCLRNGENVAFVLKDIGVLLIDGMTCGMKYYYDFLEKLSGKEKLGKVVFKATPLLDMVVSRVAPVASLTLSGRLVVFPEFRKDFVPKPPPRLFRKSSGNVPGEGKQKKEEALPLLVQGKTVRFTEVPTFIRRFTCASISGEDFRSTGKVSSPLPAIPTVSETHEQQGQAGTKDQEDLGQTKGTRHVKFQESEQGAGKAHEGGALKMWKGKALHPQLVRRQTASRIGDRRSSRVESSLSKAGASRLPLLACDSVKLHRLRAKQARPARAAPQETAASASHRERCLPKESSTNRSGWLPPIHKGTESSKRQPPKPKPPQ
ncbi:uncharacterized protein LOC110391255 [Numida meleagris]|uniref:uncharacterized protein LOC110391255 n=1 Tax=Numida meleagris TaxID=8996 RepID=UPI000B3D891D|nr:uncharacterized protein LOC110391255 [Numida meleagris]